MFCVCVLESQICDGSPWKASIRFDFLHRLHCDIVLLGKLFFSPEYNPPFFPLSLVRNSAKVRTVMNHGGNLSLSFLV